MPNPNIEDDNIQQNLDSLFDNIDKARNTTINIQQELDSIVDNINIARTTTVSKKTEFQPVSDTPEMQEYEIKLNRKATLFGTKNNKTYRIGFGFSLTKPSELDLMCRIKEITDKTRRSFVDVLMELLREGIKVYDRKN